ncbi:sn-glycerol-3-phosphate ABC transporter ATP-binding protein UgpC [Photobacterium profundum]|uniref:ABC transporter ATP-binding protein n=1 Tax=Photobacterium profundum TaxID=74109 RepID=UPI003D121C11
MTKLIIKDLSKAYGGHVVMPNINLTINNGEFVVFVGPSGCGKSTLLRMIAGLESITKGDISLNGKQLNNVHPSARKVAMVFQSYALYPHMTVEKNMAFPLKMAGVNKRIIDEKVADTAKNLQLDPYLDRLPGALSGGQRQRVAIGRAIVREPELFLFDEPLSNLDAKLRGEMRIYLKQLHQKLDATMIYVTHDQVEAMTLADRIVVLNQGQIEQIGTPEELYLQPKNRFVASFIGTPEMNFLEGNNQNQLFKIGLFNSLNTIACNGPITLGIRANQVTVDHDTFDAKMKVDVIEPLGHARLYYGKIGGQKFTIESQESFNIGEEIPVNLSQSIQHWFDADDLRIINTNEARNAA